MQPAMTLPRYFKLTGRADIVAVSILVLFLCGWHWRVTGALSAAAAAVFIVFVALCLAWGSMFTRLIAASYNSQAGVALSERQLYVGATTFGGQNPIHEARVDEVQKLGRFADAQQIEMFVHARGIDWFLQHPKTNLSWPDAVSNHPAFACGGYRLFHFVQRAAAHSADSAASLTVSNKGP